MSETIAVIPKGFLGEEWAPTMQLRFGVYSDDPRRTKVLQQKWVERTSGRPEWRNVPSEYID